MANINRRKVLKGLSVTGVAAVVPFSLQAAKTQDKEQNLAFYIDARHGQFKNSTSNEIVNQGNQPIVLNANEPVAYKNTNGQNITLHINSSEDSYALQPGERLQVYAKATMINSPKSFVAQDKWLRKSIAIA